MRTTHATPLTARQAEVLAVFRRILQETGRPPTVRELGAHLGLMSPHGTMCHLLALVKKGKLRHANGTTRGFTPIGEDGCCPTCGHQLEPDASTFANATE